MAHLIWSTLGLDWPMLKQTIHNTSRYGLNSDQQRPPQIKCVATLPCELSVSAFK